MQDYKFLQAVIMICATLVNTHTDTASQAKNHNAKIILKCLHKSHHCKSTYKVYMH